MEPSLIPHDMPWSIAIAGLLLVYFFRPEAAAVLAPWFAYAGFVWALHSPFAALFLFMGSLACGVYAFYHPRLRGMEMASFYYAGILAAGFILGAFLEALPVAAADTAALVTRRLAIVVFPVYLMLRSIFGRSRPVF